LLRPWPARCCSMERAASSRCWSVCGLSSAGVFQRRKVDLLLSLRRLRSCCSRAPPPPSPALPRAAGRSIRPAVLQNHHISPTHALAVRCCRCAGRGERGGRRGRHHLRVLRQHPGRRPAPALPPLPRAACRSIRSLRGQTVCLLPCVTLCVVAAVRRVKDGGGENEPGLSCTRSRHEKDDDKKDKKKVETVLISTI